MGMKTRLLFPLVLLFLAAACEDEQPNPGPDPVSGVDLSELDYAPEDYDLVVPENYRVFPMSAENPMTVQGVELGRHLFYDKRLSSDGSQSCASCHMPAGSFTDNRAVSVGVEGNAGVRSSMPILDLVYVKNGLFWDGRAPNLEVQAIEPVEDPVELFEDWDNVLAKLRAEKLYHRLFREAFGIHNSDEISRDLATRAIAQFERSIVTSGQSKYDRFVNGDPTVLNDAEIRGLELFFDEVQPDAECGHCHAPPLFTTNEFINNGIEDVESLEDFPDRGRGDVTGQLFDNGKFRVPTLRNIELTAPYMHDGRFATLEEVMEHYNSGVHFTANLDPNVKPDGLGLSEQNISDVIAFMKALTDTQVTTDPRYQNPFE